MTQVTVDGVMQGNGPTDVDHGNGFERGGWALGAGDDQTRALITETPDLALDLVDSRADSKGVTIQVYRPAGRPQYAAG